MNFSNLKKQSTDFTRLLKEVDKLSSPPSYEREEDEGFWKLSPDKSGNALAVIRFLPEPAVDGDEALPWVQYFDHGFQNKATGKWYIEKSLTTLNQKDPVSDYNSVLWGDQTNRDPNYRVEERNQARNQKRRLHYVSNIYVVSDPKNPENEGKVFRFKYGKKIFDKITKMMRPDLETEPKINPFDLFTGANFKLKMTRQSGFPNYDESVFLAPGPLSTDEKELERIWKSEYSLKEIVDPKNFKTYEELKRRLDEVLGESTSAQAPRTLSESPKARPVPTPDPVTEESAPWADSEEDEDLALFRSLAEE